MDRNFVISASVAAAFHAGLLFGIPGAPAKPALTKSDPASTLIDVFKIFNEPPPPETNPEVVSGPRGSPDAYRPTLDEVPRTASATDFEIKAPSSTPVRIDMRVLKLSSEQFGDPKGLPDGIGTNFDGPIGLEGLDNTPRTRMQAAPIYPHAAKVQGLGGDVLVEFTVDESGSVVSPHVVKSSNSVFEEAAVRAVARWKFEPGKRGGRVVRFKMAVPIVFNLNDNL